MRLTVRFLVEMLCYDSQSIRLVVDSFLVLGTAKDLATLLDDKVMDATVVTIKSHTDATLSVGATLETEGNIYGTEDDSD